MSLELRNIRACINLELAHPKTGKRRVRNSKRKVWAQKPPANIIEITSEQLFNKINACLDKPQSLALLKKQGRKFSLLHWDLFFNKTTEFLLDEIRKDVGEDDSFYVNALERISKMNVAFTAHQVSKMLFIYGIWSENRCLDGALSAMPDILKNYLLDGLERNIETVYPLDIQRIAVGLKVYTYTDTPQLDSIIAKLYAKIQGGLLLEQESLSGMVSKGDRNAYRPNH